MQLFFLQIAILCFSNRRYRYTCQLLLNVSNEPKAIEPDLLAYSAEILIIRFSAAMNITKKEKKTNARCIVFSTQERSMSNYKYSQTGDSVFAMTNHQCPKLAKVETTETW